MLQADQAAAAPVAGAATGGCGAARGDDLRYNARVDLLSVARVEFRVSFRHCSGQSIHWFLKRNCSVTPAQLGWLYASLCVVSLGIGTFFWLQGAVLILPFAVARTGGAWASRSWLYARHAADGEKISLQGGRLVVELENARAPGAHGIRPRPGAGRARRGDRSLIEVSGQGRR